MPINDITLAGGMRTDLTNLQLISALQARTSERLSTGKRVNSAIDDPAAYFAAQANLGRAADLSARKDEMGEAIQTVQAGNQGITAITDLIQQAKGLAASAKASSDATERSNLATQFGDLMTQIDQLATDAGYKGTNLLAGDSLTVAFNEDASSTLTVTGFDASSGGLGIGAATGNWAANTDVDAAITDLNAALVTLRSSAKTLSSNNSVISTRQSFVGGMVTTLTQGADQLTASDPNEEGANMLALQTRMQLGVAALGLSNQAQQSILRLF